MQQLCTENRRTQEPSTDHAHAHANRCTNTEPRFSKLDLLPFILGSAGGICAKENSNTTSLICLSTIQVLWDPNHRFQEVVDVVQF